MKRIKAAGILGALALAAITLFTSVPASGEPPFLITSMVSRLKRFCDPGELRSACRYIATLIAPAAAAGGPGNLDDETFLKTAVVRMPPALGRFAPAERNCLGCLQKVSDLEQLLANNGTARDIVDMMDDACVARYKNDPAKADQCVGEIAMFVPEMIDTILANLPPQTACESGSRRPMNYCAP